MTNIDNYTNPLEDIEGKIESVKDWTMPVPMTSSTVKVLDSLIKEYGEEVRKTKDDEDAINAIKDFSNKLKATYSGHWLRNEYNPIFDKDTALFTQSIQSESGPIRIQGQSINPGKGLTGDSAIIAIQNLMGIGRPTKIPLWHSGIVLTIANFKENEMLSLNHSLNEQRIELGYSTQAFLFSGTDVNIVMEVVDFILDHVIATNIKGWMKGDKEELKELILVSDIQALCAGALDSIYPSGYPTERHCINGGTDKCTYKPTLKRKIGELEFHTDSLLRFNRTMWVDTNRVSLEAKQHMAMPVGTHTTEDILKYQKSFNNVDNLSSTVDMASGTVRMAFQIPTLNRYEQIGSLWITGVMDMVDRAMAAVNDSDKKLRASKRRNFIKDYEFILRFQKHTAWIKSIQYSTGEADAEATIIEDAKTIFSLMGTLAQSEALVKTITKDIDKYREDTQVSFTGIPNYVCPSCGTPQVEGEEAKHSLIPMDMVTYFFTLMAWRLGRITQAQMEL